jgi:hypothetical protein
VVGCGGARIFPRRVAQVGVSCVCGGAFFSNLAKRTQVLGANLCLFRIGTRISREKRTGCGGWRKWLEGEGRKKRKRSDPEFRRGSSEISRPLRHRGLPRSRYGGSAEHEVRSSKIVTRTGYALRHPVWQNS